MKIEKICDNLKTYINENIHHIDNNNTTYHCAATISNGKILTIGLQDFNRSKGFGITKIAEHAEEQAIRKLYSKYARYFKRIMCKKMEFKTNKKIDIIVIRINNKNELLNSKCCSVCLKIMQAYNIRNIYYSNDKGVIVKEKIKIMIPEYNSSGAVYLLEIMKKNKTNNNIMFIILDLN